MSTIATVELGEAGLRGLQIKADKLNKRAKRKGMNRLVVEVVHEWVSEPDSNGLTENRYRVIISGKSPRINGWRIAARIELNGLAGTMIHVVPGDLADCDYSEFREYKGSCDHCNSKRRRNDVFVLTHEEGRRIVVGRNCLADFVRSEEADDFATYAEYCEIVAGWDVEACDREAYDDGFGAGRNVPTIGIGQFLRVTALLIRKTGWVSRSAASGRDDCYSTVDGVNYYFYGRGPGYKNFVEKLGTPSDGDRELSVKSLEWAQSLSEEEVGKSEYLYNIRKIAQGEIVGPGIDGYAASIVSAYQRDCDRKAEYAKEQEGTKEKGYLVGELKQRIKGLSVRVVRVRYFEGDFGVTTIVAMESDLPDGKVAPITWFASGSKEFDEGADYTMTATIKGFKDDPKYGLQTFVNRAILVKC